MPRFSAFGFRSVVAPSIDDAARVFATRQARRLFGRRAYLRTFRVDSWTRDRSFITVEFFDHHGRPSGPSVCVGRDVRLTVSRL